MDMRSPLSSGDPRLSMSSYPRSELSRTNSFASSLREHALRSGAPAHPSGSLSESQSLTEDPKGERDGGGGGNGDGDGDGPLKVLRQNLHRRLTTETQKWKGREGGQRGPGHAEGAGQGQGAEGEDADERYVFLVERPSPKVYAIEC